MKLPSTSWIVLVAAMTAAVGNCETSMDCASACKYLSYICPKRCMEYKSTERDGFGEREMNGVTVRATHTSTQENMNLSKVFRNLQSSLNYFPEYNKTIDIKIEWNSIDKNLVIKKETFYHNVLDENMIVEPNFELDSPQIDLNKNEMATDDELEDLAITQEKQFGEDFDSLSNVQNSYSTENSIEEATENSDFPKSRKPSSIIFFDDFPEDEEDNETVEDEDFEPLMQDDAFGYVLERKRRSTEIPWPWRDPTANCTEPYNFFPFCPETWKMFGLEFHSNCKPEPVPGRFLYPHPKKCSSYYTMIGEITDYNHRLELQKCQSGLIFDASRGRCSHPSNVKNRTCDSKFPCQG